MPIPIPIPLGVQTKSTKKDLIRLKNSNINKKATKKFDKMQVKCKESKEKTTKNRVK